MATAPTFHLFPELPSEIRLKIWRHLLQTPRTVELSCKRGINPGSRRFAEAFSSKGPVPPLLHINREARYEALKVYTPHFKTGFSPNQIYMAFDRDVVKVPEGVLTYIARSDLQEIQYMSMEVRDHAYFGHFNMDSIRKMSNLKELELISGHGVIYSWDQSGHLVTGPGVVHSWDRPGNQWFEVLRNEFEEGRIQYAGWECPRVRIVAHGTGEEIAVVEAGAAEPGSSDEEAPMTDIIMGPITWT